MKKALCDLCGSDNAELVFIARDTNYHRPGVFCIVRCQNCGLAYLSPRPEAEEMVRFYPNQGYTPYRRADDRMDGAYCDVLQELSRYKQGGRLLDVGCGTGRFLKAARDRGWQGIGIEVSEEGSRQARDNLGLEVITGELLTINFPDGFFDVVTMWHVLEHLHCPAATLNKIGSILRDDGILAIEVPNFASLERRVFGKEWITVDAPRHLYHFTPNTLSRLLDKVGFEVLDLRCQGSSPSLAVNILRAGKNLIQRRSRGMNISLNEPLQQETWGEGFKDRVRRVATTLVVPLASTIDRFGWGAAIRVYAQKRGRGVPRDELGQSHLS